MNFRMTTRGLLTVVAGLLALNLAGMLVRPSAGSEAAAILLPQAQAGTVLKTDGPQFITASEDGTVIHVWELGRFVGEGYESVKVQTFNSSGNRVN